MGNLHIWESQRPRMWEMFRDRKGTWVHKTFWAGDEGRCLGDFEGPLQDDKKSLFVLFKVKQWLFFLNWKWLYVEVLCILCSVVNNPHELLSLGGSGPRSSTLSSHMDILGASLQDFPFGGNHRWSSHCVFFPWGAAPRLDYQVRPWVPQYPYNKFLNLLAWASFRFYYS